MTTSTHTIDMTETWFTNDLVVPDYEFNIFRWDPTLQAYLFNEALEEATAELTMPTGFPVKQHLETTDLVERTLEVADWVLEGASQADIEVGKFDVPEGWDVNEAAWGQPAQGEME